MSLVPSKQFSSLVLTIKCNKFPQIKRYLTSIQSFSNDKWNEARSLLSLSFHSDLPHAEQLSVVAHFLAILIPQPEYSLWPLFDGLPKQPAHLECQVLRVKGEARLFDSIISVFLSSHFQPTFHQVFFCAASTALFELEEFVARAMFDFSHNRGANPVYVIVSFELLSLGLQAEFKALLERISAEEKREKFANLVVLFEGVVEDKVNLLDDFREAKECPMLEKEKL